MEEPIPREPEAYLRPSDVARALGVTLTTVQRWIDSGKITSHRTLGGHRRVSSRELSRLTQERGIPFPAATARLRNAVLVVDDDDDFREVLVASVRNLRPELQVLEASSGFDAGVLVARERPRLMLLDLRMPGMDGVAVCRGIKSDARTAGTVVVGMTVSTDPQWSNAILAAGAVSCLAKPLSREALLAILAEHAPAPAAP